MNSRHFALIMAGGQGSRFWPYSTEDRPKQFLSIVGRDTLIRQTFDRLASFIAVEDIFVVADRRYLSLVIRHLPQLPPENFIAEPCPRNTAPCLMLANMELQRRDPEANLLVVPADHYIPETDVFARQMKAALGFADRPRIITAGVKPTMAHTGYGYIHFDAARFERVAGTCFYDVVSFKEKPGKPTARRYYMSGTHFWNSGMFVYKLSHFRALLARYAPYYGERYEALNACLDRPETFARCFADLRPDSIDFALMEKAKEVTMFEAKFTWNDVGAWLSVYELNAKDVCDNVNVSEHILLDTRESLVFSTTGLPIATIGLKEMAVIHTENGILVAPLKQLQRVKEILPHLK